MEISKTLMLPLFIRFIIHYKGIFEQKNWCTLISVFSFPLLQHCCPLCEQNNVLLRLLPIPFFTAQKMASSPGDDLRRGRSQSSVFGPRDLQVTVNTRITERLNFLEPELQATNSRIDIIETMCQANMDRIEAMSKHQSRTDRGRL